MRKYYANLVIFRKNYHFVNKFSLSDPTRQKRDEAGSFARPGKMIQFTDLLYFNSKVSLRPLESLFSYFV